jgi:hypothetical protein
MRIRLLGFVRAYAFVASLDLDFWVLVCGRAQSEMGCINSSSLRSFIELLIHPISLCFVCSAVIFWRFMFLLELGLERDLCVCLI